VRLTLNQEQAEPELALPFLSAGAVFITFKNFATPELRDAAFTKQAIQ
jgi:hypothetical protein